MKEYFVIRVETCPACNGDGWIVNPAWELYEQEMEQRHGKYWYREISPQEWDLVASELGFSEVPCEETPCHRCNGEGKIRSEVPLADALRDLGIISE